MGDVILTTPVFNYLKEINGDNEIVLLTDLNYVELFADDPRLKSVLGFKKDAPLTRLSIFDEEWDQIIDLQNNKRSRSIISLIKKSKKIGSFQKLHFQRNLLLLTRANLYPTQSDVITRYLQAADAQNIPPDLNKAPKLHFSPSAYSQYEKIIQSDAIIRPTIALLPFSAWKNKEWPLKSFEIVGKFFITMGWNVVILGSKSEQEQADQLRSLIGSKSISLAGALSLYQCGCVLSKCNLALGNDSGLSHLARACGVKTGIIYGPTTRHFGFFPSGSPAFKIFETELFCRPCHPHGGNICLQLKHDCMRKIKPETVLKELMEFFLKKD
jgi:heptosyltransferase-2